MKKRIHLILLFLVITSLTINGCDQSGGGCGAGNEDEDIYTIEAKYAQTGEYATNLTIVAATVTTDAIATGFTIYHPQSLTGNHPIITWGNATGTPTVTYEALLRHLASWGFVAIASDSVMTLSGEEMIEGINYLIKENSNPDSIFYNKLDTTHIGTTGHSQGGGGAVNTATDERVTCSAPLAPARGNIEAVKGPMLLLAGDLDTIVPIALLRYTTFSVVTVPTIFAIHQNMGHMDFLRDGGGARGYLTAWFMYQLQGDEEAALAFTMEDGEIFHNAKFNVETKNF